jgi:predicted nucleic acid-binding protein
MLLIALTAGRKRRRPPERADASAGLVVASSARLIALSPADYTATLRRASEMGLSGGVIYDALIARAAEKAGAERLLTLNEADFRRVWPEGESILLVP